MEKRVWLGQRVQRTKGPVFWGSRVQEEVYMEAGHTRLPLGAGPLAQETRRDLRPGVKATTKGKRQEVMKTENLGH